MTLIYYTNYYRFVGCVWLTDLTLTLSGPCIM